MPGNRQTKKYHHHGKWSAWEDLQRKGFYIQDKENRDFSFQKGGEIEERFLHFKIFL